VCSYNASLKFLLCNDMQVFSNVLYFMHMGGYHAMFLQVTTFVSQFLFINFVGKCRLDVRIQVHHVTIGVGYNSHGPQSCFEM